MKSVFFIFNNQPLKYRKGQDMRTLIVLIAIVIVAFVILICGPLSRKKREQRRLRKMAVLKKERQKRWATAMCASKRDVEAWMVKLANFWKVPIERSGEDGLLSPETYDRMFAEALSRGEDPMVAYELLFGVGYDFWSDEQWAKVIEAYFPHPESMQSRLDGIDNVFGRPGLMQELLRLYVRNPGVLTPFLRKLTEDAIGMAKQQKLGDVGKLLLCILPQLQAAPG